MCVCVYVYICIYVLSALLSSFFSLLFSRLSSLLSSFLSPLFPMLAQRKLQLHKQTNSKEASSECRMLECVVAVASQAASRRSQLVPRSTRPAAMSSFAETETDTGGFYDDYSYTDDTATLALGASSPKRRIWNRKCQIPAVEADLRPETIWVWSSPSSFGSPWSPQGDIVPEPEPWSVRMAKELETARVAAAKKAESKSESKAKRKPTGKTKTKSQQSKKENKGENNKGKETKEKKDCMRQ